jgi:hypothetical protein
MARGDFSDTKEARRYDATEQSVTHVTAIYAAWEAADAAALRAELAGLS